MGSPTFYPFYLFPLQIDVDVESRLDQIWAILAVSTLSIFVAAEADEFTLHG